MLCVCRLHTDELFFALKISEAQQQCALDNNIYVIIHSSRHYSTWFFGVNHYYYYLAATTVLEFRNCKPFAWRNGIRTAPNKMHQHSHLLCPRLSSKSTQDKDQCLVPSLMVMEGTQVRTMTNCEKNVFYSFLLLSFFLYYYYYY